MAVGGDLEPGTLLHAYRSGLFPMPIGRRDRIGWFSPDPRAVLAVDGLRVTRSLRQSMRRLDLSTDRCFTEVMRQCADPDRPHGWITPKLVEAYTRLHELGWAHSVEVWADAELVGGLYGVSIGSFFAGESMFHRTTDASKVALAHLVDVLRAAPFSLLDVQWLTPHLASLGALEMTRSEYLARLRVAVQQSPVSFR